MKIKLGVYVLAVVFIVDFSFAKNEQKRRRPIIDSTAQDSDGNYIDQIALDTINHSSTNGVKERENYPSQYYTATDEFRKSFSKNPTSEPKVHYITPEPYSNNFSQDYVHHALQTHEKSKEKSPVSSILEYSTASRNEPKNISTQKRRRMPVNDPEDYNYYFPESKRITAKSTAKPITTKDTSEKYYKPQSAGAIITKDLKTNGDEMVNTYHYYYPEESTHEEKLNQNSFDFVSSTFAPSTTKAPKIKFASRKKTPSVHMEHTSTDAYQYPPVLQRPSQYTPTENVHDDFYPAYPTHDNKNFAAHSTSSPSTASPIKMLKPTKKNHYYLPSSTMSPSSTTRSTKTRRPSTETPYEDIKQFSVSPSSSTITHYSTTRAPELYKYSTPSPVSSTTSGDFYIKPSTQVTPSATPSAVDLIPYGSDNTVVIRPKTQYQNHEAYEPMKERVVYRFVPEEIYSYEPNKTDTFNFYTSPSSLPETVDSTDYYKTLNQTSQADLDFYNDFHKNYNYEYFTEQDAGASPLQSGTIATDGSMKMEHGVIDDKQKATKKNMMFSIEPQMNEYHQQGSMMSPNLEDHEVPPPMNEPDRDAEESKNQYFVLYSVDEEEKKQKKQKRKQKPEPEVIYHHHQHEHDKGEEFQHFESDFESEFDSELTNTDNVRIVDPSVRNGRPLEFTKDDYLRHIKQAVVQYMKDYQPKDSSSDTNVKLKNQRYQESVRETPHRPTKTPSAATTASSYKHKLPSNQYKSIAPMKLPKNVYTAGRLSDAIEEMQESPNIDLTVKKSKQKPFDLSAIDVGQSYQHVSHFDHSAALKNVEEFDQSDVIAHHQNKPKLHFSQQTYHDINNLGYNQKQKQPTEENESDSQSHNLFKGYMLQNKYNSKGNQGGSSSFSSMNYDASKLPRIVSQRGQDDDEDDNDVKDPVDSPIQIINGIPVSNPYNIDLNTLKHMLGGIAQAEVDDQLKDLDDSPSNNQKFPSNWKSYPQNQFGSYTSNSPIYQVFGQQENSQRHKKNSGQTGNYGSNSQQSKFPLVGTLVNFNKGKTQSNKQKNSNRENRNNQNYAVSDFSGWNQMSKKQRIEPQVSSSNSHYVLRPVLKNKQARDEQLFQKGSINRARQPKLSTDMRPPPPIKQKAHVRVVKVL